MNDFLDFTINFLLAFGTGIAAIACLWDVAGDKKYQAIPALICFALGYFRMGILWASSANGTLSMQQLVTRDPVAAFFGSTFLKAALLGSTILSCIFWLKFDWFKSQYHTLFKK